MLETISQFWGQYGGLLLEGTRDTLIMVFISTLFAYVIGLPLGVLLSITQPHGIWPHKWLNRILGWIINVGRSLPFIILMIAIMPFTKALVGTKIGVPGAIVPLVVSAAPFIARMVETSLAEVDAGVVEAAQSMGASNLQIVWKVYLPEAVPSLILGASISIITLLGYTAIAGAVGAGGVPGGRVAAAVRLVLLRLGAGGGGDLDGAALGQAWLGGEGGVDGEQGFVDEPHQVLVGGIAAGIGMQSFPLVVTQGKGLRRRSSPTALVRRGRRSIRGGTLAAVPVSAAGGQ